MNVKGKYLRDENDSIISPVGNASTIYINQRPKFGSVTTDLATLLNDKIPRVAQNAWGTKLTVNNFQVACIGILLLGFHQGNVYTLWRGAEYDLKTSLPSSVGTITITDYNNIVIQLKSSETNITVIYF